MKKKMVALAITAACILSVPVASHAKSLADSFSGGSYYDCVDVSYSTGAQKYKKTTYAKTVGYEPNHYVLAYIGGNMNSDEGAVAKRKYYGYGDISASCNYSAWVDKGLIAVYKWVFPTGYAKYGH